MDAMQKVTGYKPARWKWRLLLAAGVIGLLLGGYWLLKPSRAEDGYRYVTQAVRTGELNVTVSASGYLEPLESVEVGTEVSGTVLKVWADYNDEVKKGQLLAQLDQTKFQSAVDNASAALAGAEASLSSAEAELFRTGAAVRRNKALRKTTKGALPSPSDWDEAWAADLSAKAQVDLAKTKVDQARYSLVSAQYDLERTMIHSPIDGIVLSRDVDVGQTVAASYQTPVLFTIAKDLRQMELQVSIDEADIARVNGGQSAVFSVDAYPDAIFEGHIRTVRVDSEIEDGVVTYIAVLDVDNGDLRLRPGMSADAEITTRTFRDALIVPRAALLYLPVTIKEPKLFAFDGPAKMTTEEVEEHPHVWRLHKEQPEKLNVETLGTNGTQSVVQADGLQPGDKLIIAQEKQP